jgi:hypothetical protein
MRRAALPGAAALCVALRACGSSRPRDDATTMMSECAAVELELAGESPPELRAMAGHYSLVPSGWAAAGNSGGYPAYHSGYCPNASAPSGCPRSTFLAHRCIDAPFPARYTLCIQRVACMEMCQYIWRTGTATGSSARGFRPHQTATTQRPGCRARCTDTPSDPCKLDPLHMHGVSDGERVRIQA